MYLVGHQSMNPNDPDRIAIKRDGTFVKNIVDTTMKHYRIAMKNWSAGTGGGSGAPENYEDWNSRSDELFQNYDQHRGHYLAWIYMKDKKVGYLFDAKNDPVPPHVHLEDGDDISRSLTPTSTMLTSKFNKSFIAQFQSTSSDITNAFKSSFEQDETSSKRESIANLQSSILQANTLKRSLEDDDALDPGKRMKRIEIHERTIDTLYDQLDALNDD